MDRKAADNLGVLLRSYEALYNWRALSMLAGSFAVAGLAIIGASDMALRGGGQMALAMLLGLVALVVAVMGANGSGLMLADQAYDRPIRPFVNAFLGGLRVTLAAIGALVSLGIGYALVLLLVFLLSFLARIPGIGGAFAFLLAGPSVLALALALTVLLLAAPLALAGLWHGDGMIAALTRAVTIVVKRPLDVFMRFLVLGLIVMPVAIFLFAMVGVGNVSVAGMYVVEALRSTMGYQGGMGGGAYGGMGPMASVLRSLVGQGLGAAGVSTALVWYLAFAVVALIHMLGVIWIYESVSDGIGLEGLGAVRRQAARIKARMDEHKPTSTGPGGPSS